MEPSKVNFSDDNSWSVQSEPVSSSIHWIDTEQALNDALEQIFHNGLPSVIAIDTEFERSNTFYSIGGLLQICDQTSIYLIDLIQFSDGKNIPRSLKVLLTDPGCLKVLHAGKEDIELLYDQWDLLIEPTLDTQWAANFLLEKQQIGLQGLVALVLEIELEKGETRSNWIHRPLSEKQIRYAALDVWYLIPLFERLLQRLELANICDEVHSDCQWINLPKQKTPMEIFYWMSDSWSLTIIQQKRLIALIHWKYEFIRQKNIPPAWALSESLLTRLAILAPKTIKGLEKVCADAQRFLRHHLKGTYKMLLTCIEEPETYFRLNENNSDLISFPVPPLLPCTKPLQRLLSEVVSKNAKLLRWSKVQLCRKRWLNELLRIYLYCRYYQKKFDRSLLPRVWQEWRGDLMLNQLLLVLKSQNEAVDEALSSLAAAVNSGPVDSEQMN